MDSSRSGINVAPQPESDAPPRWFTTDAERRAFGWVAIVVSLVCCAPLVWVSTTMIRNWDRLGQSNTPFWILPLVLVGYAAPAVAMLCVGRGLLSGRVAIAKFGGGFLVAAVVTGITLFAVFD